MATKIEGGTRGRGSSRTSDGPGDQSAPQVEARASGSAGRALERRPKDSRSGPRRVPPAGTTPSLDGQARTPGSGAAPPSDGAAPAPQVGARQAREGARAHIEEELRRANVQWRGVDRARPGLGAPDGAVQLQVLERLPLRELAAELERLPPGGLLRLVADDAAGRGWLALREHDGVRLAREGTAEATALRLTHDLRSDLHFLGATVDLGAKGLTVVLPPPELGSEARRGLRLGDVVSLDLAALAAGGLAPDQRLQQTGRAATDDAVATETARSLRQRLLGVAVPVGHWLSTAGVAPGVLVASAAIDGRSVWSHGDGLAALDAVGKRAGAEGKPLVVQLVTRNGFERRAFAPAPDGAWSEAEKPVVEVTLTARASNAPEVGALVKAGALAGFPVAFGVNGPTGTPPGEPLPTAASSEAGGASGASARTEDLAALDRSIVALYSMADRWRRVDAAASDARCAGLLVRLQAEAYLAAELRSELVNAGKDPAWIGNPGDYPKVLQELGQETPKVWDGCRGEARSAQIFVEACERVLSNTGLSAHERSARVAALRKHYGDSPSRHPPDSGAEAEALVATLRGELSALADRPAPATNDSDGPSEATSAEILSNYVHTLRGTVDEWTSALARGEFHGPIIADQLWSRFSKVAMGEPPAVSPRERLLAIREAAIRLSEEASDLRQQMQSWTGARFARALEGLKTLSGFAERLERGDGEPAAVLESLRSTIDWIVRAPDEAPTMEAAAKLPEGAQRFAGLAELEAFLRSVEPGGAVELGTADAKQRLSCAKDASGAWSKVSLATDPAPDAARTRR